MKWLLVCVALTGVLVEANPLEGRPWSYHRDVGIPRSEHLKKIELAANASRIFGGTTIPAGVHPFMVGIVIILDSPFTSMCGASLLTSSRSLTAAHCWWDGWLAVLEFELVFGSPTLHVGGLRIRTADVEMHPDYSIVTVNFDIAMIRHPAVSFNNLVSPIQLPINQLSNDFVGVWATAAGYGRTEYMTGPVFNPPLKQASLQVITNTQCLQFFSSIYIVPSTLCTMAPTGINICSGDSGGPLFVGSGNNRALIGVTSFGGGNCGDGTPAGFVRVTSVLPWILSRL